MIGTIFKVIGGLLAATVIGVMILAGIKGSPSSDTANANMLATAYLQKHSGTYAQCAKSTGGEGELVTGQVVFEMAPDYPFERLQKLERQYLAKIKQECEKQIKDYEDNYSTLETTELEIAQANHSALDKLLGNSPKPDTAKLREYSPDLITVIGGGETESLVFTKADVKKYFKANL